MQDTDVNGTEEVGTLMRVKVGFDTVYPNIRMVRRMVAYAIHHYATVREVAFSALVECGYMDDCTEPSCTSKQNRS